MNIISERRLVLILAALSAITPLAIDMYLPAINNMAEVLSTTNEQVSISVSVFFLGLALGQLFGGPISDAYGRFPMVFLGLSVFGVINIAILFVTQVEILWILRFLQAFGGGIATVNVSATVRDMFSGTESARVFSLIGSIGILAPLIAPSLGLLFMLIGNWQLIFAFLFIYSLIALFFYQKNFKGVYVKKENAKVTPIKNYVNVFTSGRPMLMILALIISSSGLYCVITSSSFMYTKYFGLSTPWYVFFFSLNIILMLIMVRVNIKFVRKFTPIKLLKTGIFLQVIFSIILMLAHKSTTVFLIAPLIAIYVSMQGLIFGNAISLILDNFPKISASANAVIGSLQYGAGALSGFIASHFSDGTLFPITTTLFVSSFIGATILFFSLKR
ncbi:MAG: multidrug effflux MFS transporter [Campylobacteraceae bacterium]